MTALQAALLGIIQGLTEFLPVSSSAHLILARAAFGWSAGEFGLAFDVACHVGTLGAVLVYFRRDLVAMVASAPGALSVAPNEPALLVRHVVIGTVPIVVVGLLFADVITSTLRTPAVAATALAIGAFVMLAAERVGSKSRTEATLSSVEAFGLGLAQAAALVPGVSRSGAVIVVAMFCGLRRERAARFAFLLGIPAICGAAGREALELSGQAWPAGVTGLLVVGMAASAVVGYVTVKYFIRYLAGHALDAFAAYRLVLAAVILVVLVSS